MWKWFRAFGKDPFGHWLPVKGMMISFLGVATFHRFSITNSLRVEGTEHLRNLPQNNVLFLSNHQTYFADVMAFYHIFCSVKWGFKNTVNFPVYLLAPRVNTYYVAASETMDNTGLLPRLFKYAGAVTVERSWRAKGQDVQRELDTSGQDKIGMALGQGWLVSFPQGTTSPYAPIRKGTAHIIKNHQPVVIPVVINGFRRAFDKKGLFPKKTGVQLSVRFKPPLAIDYNAPVEDIVELIRKQIEQETPWGHDDIK